MFNLLIFCITHVTVTGNLHHQLLRSWWWRFPVLPPEISSPPSSPSPAPLPSPESPLLCSALLSAPLQIAANVGTKMTA